MQKNLLSLMGGVKLTHLSSKAVVAELVERISQKDYQRPLTVFTPNTEQLMQAKELPAFLEVLNAAQITIPDSVGLVGADWWRAFTTGGSWQVRDRVTGVDLAESLLSEAAEQGWKVVLVGGTDDSGKRAIEVLKKRFRRLDIWYISVGKVTIMTNNQETRSKQTLDVSMKNEAKTIEQINKIKPDLILVGLGAPKQEVWVMKYGEKFKTQAIMVVGGAIEMWAGVQRRAPKWMRDWGMEWLWRLMEQPQRIGRQMRLWRFGWLVVRGKI